VGNFTVKDGEPSIFSGSLVTKDLSDIVKAEDFVLGSEYLQTICVVVPKLLAKEWESRYHTFAGLFILN
jgi:V-type H+-transporting ATPase subunit C